MGATTPAAIVPQEIRFCRTIDGVQLAYARIGQGPPLVRAGAFLTHLEKELESPIWRHLWRDLARDYTLIRYDARGNGLSDWEVDDLSFAAFVQDLETVVDAVGFDRFALLGISQGCAVSIAYTVRHPERVTRLVLYGGFAQGAAKRARSAAEREQLAAVLTLVQLAGARRTQRSGRSSRRSSCPEVPKSRSTGGMKCNAYPRRPRMPRASSRRFWRNRCNRSSGESDGPNLGDACARRGPSAIRCWSANGGGDSRHPLCAAAEPEPSHTRERARLRPVPGGDQVVPPRLNCRSAHAVTRACAQGERRCRLASRAD